MVGAMLVVLVVIGAFVAFRAVNRDDVEIQREPVDHLATVEGMQQEGERWLAYPPTLPEGWIATAVAVEAGPRWALSLLTEDERFVGVRQARGASVEALVDEYVDDAAVEGDAVRLDSALATQWRSFTDEGGDYAVAADLGRTAVLVVGTAPADEVQALAASLVTAPVDGASG